MNKSLRYKCLVLDHDDTVVQSTPNIHYPAFCQAMKELRPTMEIIPYNVFVKLCFNPGFLGILNDILKLNEEEMKKEMEIWRSFTTTIIPSPYQGMKEFLLKFRRLGGIIAVVSHSESKQIIRDYQTHFQFTPDLCFGWELPVEQRKPYTFPVNKIIENFSLNREDLLMVDDLKIGYDMANNAKIDFACAGWSHSFDEIKHFMKKNSTYYCTQIDELEKIVFLRKG